MMDLFPVLRVMVLTEVRLRMRRLSTLVVMLALVAVTWLMIADPASGNALIVVDDARVIYDSACLALGSSLLASMLFGVGGFYLVRDRMDQDLRSGAGGVLGVTPVPSAVFLLGRWLGGVAYLCLLLLVFLASMLVLHLLRGDGLPQPLVYLQTYALILLPGVLFAASMALFSEAWAPLMGKLGDVLYFLLAVLQLALSAALSTNHVAIVSPWMLIDFSGMAMSVLGFESQVHTTSMSIGSSPFDAALAPLLLPGGFWTWQMALLRCGAGLLALLPLLPALLLFHRFSPDRVKRGARHQRGGVIGRLNRLLAPSSRLITPLFGIAARLPRLPGQVLAEMALTLSPLATIALLLSLLLGAVLPAAAMPTLLTAVIALWGILISDVSVRDVRAGLQRMTGVVHGATEQYLRQLLATWLLGWLFALPVIVRWLATAPLRACALMVGVAALSACASVLGAATRGARAFLALFLFGMYVATQARQVAWLDIVGFNGVATLSSLAFYFAAGLVLGSAGWLLHRRREG